MLGCSAFLPFKTVSNGSTNAAVATLDGYACKATRKNVLAERFHRTLKEQIIEGRAFKTVDEIRKAVRQFVEIYNEKWLVAKREYQSPVEARQNYEKLRGVA